MKDFTSISCLPTFYREVFFGINEYKRKIEISQLSNANLLNNHCGKIIFFEYRDKSICFKH